MLDLINYIQAALNMVSFILLTVVALQFLGDWLRGDDGITLGLMLFVLALAIGEAIFIAINLGILNANTRMLAESLRFLQQAFWVAAMFFLIYQHRRLRANAKFQQENISESYPDSDQS